VLNTLIKKRTSYGWHFALCENVCSRERKPYVITICFSFSFQNNCTVFPVANVFFTNCRWSHNRLWE